MMRRKPQGYEFLALERLYGKISRSEKLSKRFEPQLFILAKSAQTPGLFQREGNTKTMWYNEIGGGHGGTPNLLLGIVRITFRSNVWCLHPYRRGQNRVQITRQAGRMWVMGRGSEKPKGKMGMSGVEVCPSPFSLDHCPRFSCTI